MEEDKKAFGYHKEDREKWMLYKRLIIENPDKTRKELRVLREIEFKELKEKIEVKEIG